MGVSVLPDQRLKIKRRSWNRTVRIARPASNDVTEPTTRTFATVGGAWSRPQLQALRDSARGRRLLDEIDAALANTKS